MNLEHCTGSCVKSKLLSLLFLPCSRSIRQISLRMLERLDFADFEIQTGWLQMYVPIFFCVRICSRDDEVSLGIGSCHPTDFSVFASVVHHLMECEYQSMLNSFQQQVLLCVCWQTPNRHSPGALNCVHSGTCQKIHEFHLWATSFQEVCTKLAVRFSWRTFYQ